MTLTLVTHENGDLKLHDESGNVLFDAPDDIRSSDSAERGLVEAFVAANPNADLLGDPVRPYFVALVAGDWVHRGLRNPDETVPWQ